MLQSDDRFVFLTTDLGLFRLDTFCRPDSIPNLHIVVKFTWQPYVAIPRASDNQPGYGAMPAPARLSLLRSTRAC